MTVNGKLIKLTALCIIITLLTVFFSVIPVSAAFEKADNNTRVSVGSSHGLLIDISGNVWSFGGNDYSQLGDGTIESRWEPNLVYHYSQKGRAVSVAAGNKQSMVLTENGAVLSWGFGSSEITTEFTDGVKAISAGQERSMALLNSGIAVSWGENSIKQQVKNESDEIMTNIKEISVGSNNMIVLRTADNGKVYRLDTVNYSVAIPVMFDNVSPDTILQGAVSISAGEDFAAALLESGEVYTWGQSTHGVLGQGFLDDGNYEAGMKVDALPRIAYLSAGNDHVIALADSGQFYGWGNASDKRLDANKSGDLSSPVSLDIELSGVTQYDCGNIFNLALVGTDNFYFWGNSRELYNLPLTQTLKKIAEPILIAEGIGDESVTVKWNINDYYTFLATGLMVVYSMPDGTENKTLMLPVTTSQITLIGLQPITNYSIKLQIHGKSGFVDETVPFIITTLVYDGISSLSEISSEESSSIISSDSSSDNSSSESNGGVAVPSSLGNIIIVAAVILLLLTLLAIVYIWKRIGKHSGKSNVRSVKITQHVNEYGDDPTDYENIEEGLIAIPEQENHVNGIAGNNSDWNDIGESQNDSTVGTNDRSDRFVRSDDPDDDFIIRRPGEPKQ